MPPLMTPVEDGAFTLDSSGVAGFFGGEEAIAAMATVHIYEGRKWLGWYNSPGSYTVAKKYGRLARARIWSALFPGVSVDPATLFELSGSKGPEFIGAHSGTNITVTEHVGYLFLRKCQSLDITIIEGRKTSPILVTVATLGSAPDPEIDAATPRSWYHTVAALIPILSSMAACVVCGLCADWYCFSMILLGILSNGISCFVIGSGILKFKHPKPAPGSPPGDGMLTAGAEFVVLRGDEGAVNSITRGNFTLKFSGEPEYRAIGMSAAILTAQFLLQLLLIPQGTLFGQLLFLSTLAVSWAYNCSLSSLDREVIQANILINKVLGKPEMKRFELGTRTSGVVFAALALQPPDPRKMLDRLLPDTHAWKVWKTTISQRLEKKESLSNDDFSNEMELCNDEDERRLLETLFSDAKEAFVGFDEYQKSRGGLKGETKEDDLSLKS